MTTAYIIKQQQSDLNDGVWFHEISEGTETTGTLDFTIHQNDRFMFSATPAGVPGLTGSQAGDFQVRVLIADGTADADFRVRLARISSTGTVLQESAYSDWVLMTNGLKEIDFLGLDLGTWVETNRLRIEYHTLRNTGMGAGAATMQTGTVDSGVIAPWSVVVPTILDATTAGVIAEGIPATVEVRRTVTLTATSAEAQGEGLAAAMEVASPSFLRHWPVIISNGQGQLISDGLIRTWAVSGRHGTQTLANENRAQLRAYTAYTASHMQAFISDHSGATQTIHFRRNSVDGSQSLTIDGTGLFEDITNTDEIASGDLLSYRNDGGNEQDGDTIELRWNALTFATEKDASFLAMYGAWSSSGNTFSSLVAHRTGFAVEADHQYTVRTPQTLSNLRAFITGHIDVGGGGPFDSHLHVRKNGSDGSLVLTIDGTGEFEDLTNFDTFDAGDTVNYRLTAGENMVTASANRGVTGDSLRTFFQGSLIGADEQEQFFPFGDSRALTTEAYAEAWAMAAPAEIHNLFVRCFAHQETRTLRSRVNGANGAMSVIVDGTGVFEDLTNFDALDIGDRCTISQAAGTSGNNSYFVGLEWEPQPAAVAEGLILTATIAEAQADGIAATVTAARALTLTATIAEAQSDGVPATIVTAQSADLIATTADATGAGIAAELSAARAITLTATTGEATADALPAAVETARTAVLTATVAEATADGLDAEVIAQGAAVLDATTGEATADALPAEIVTQRAAHLEATVGDATAGGIAAEVDARIAAILQPTTAEADADGLAAEVVTQSVVVLTGTVAEAGAEGLPAAIVTADQVGLTATTAEATAEGVPATVATQRVLVLDATVGEAVAEGIAAELSTARAVTLEATPAEASAEGVPAELITQRVAVLEASTGEAGADALPAAVLVGAATRLTATVADAVGEGLPATVASARAVALEATTGNASAEGIAAMISAAQSVALEATVTDATAEGIAAEILTTAVTRVQATTAGAQSDGIAAEVVTQRAAQLTATAGEAGADGIAATVSAGTTLTAQIGEADADGISATVTITREVVLDGTVGEAEASGLPATVTAIEAVVIQATIADAQAEGVPATMIAMRLYTPFAATATITIVPLVGGEVQVTPLVAASIDAEPAVSGGILVKPGGAQ